MARARRSFEVRYGTVDMRGDPCVQLCVGCVWTRGCVGTWVLEADVAAARARSFEVGQGTRAAHCWHV